jgi:hypothetical protein
MVNLLGSAAAERAMKIGGYPDDVGIVGDHVVVATVIDDRPSYDAYDRPTLEEWYEAYRYFRRKHPRESLDTCLWESRPTEGVTP